eukprot:PhM_4_TR11636/c6_g1_i2/m.6170
MTVTRKHTLNGLYGRMLRFALGLPPAYISREFVHTEALYADTPFISTTIVTQQARMVLNAHQDTETGRRVHPLGLLVTYHESAKSHKHQMLNTLMRALHVEFVEQLGELNLEDAIQQVHNWEQADTWNRIYHRREREPVPKRPPDSTLQMAGESFSGSIPHTAPIGGAPEWFSIGESEQEI